MESKRGRIPGSSNQSKRDGNAEGKGGRSVKLASTQKHQRGAKVLGPSQLLQKVYFAKIAAPLHVLVRKEQKWKWEKEQEEVFGKLKAVFTTEPVLAIPDIDREMRVGVDALDYATGGMLSMKCEDGK